MAGVFQDLRYALRMLRKNRGSTLIALVALALGIGANTAIFSVVRAVLLAPLPYRDPDDIVTLLRNSTGPATPADFLDWRAQARSFETMAAAEAWSGNLTGRERPEQITGLHFSQGMFHLLGVQPSLGRTFVPDDFVEDKDHVVVLSDRLWQRRFNRDRGVLGEKLILDGEPYTVVGIMPPQFRFAPFWITQAEMWAPFSLAKRANDRSGSSLRPFARLKPNVTRAQAQAETDAICTRLEKAYPDTNTGVRVRVDALHDQVVGNVRPALLIMLGAVGFVLLIACANVANLQLARAAARRKEIAIRAALGAGRKRIVRQVLTESLVLALTGGALGLLLAVWGVDWLRTVAEAGPAASRFKIPRAEEIGMNSAVLGFSLAVSIVSGVIFGLFPALQVSRGDLNEPLKESGRSATLAASGTRLRGVLVIAEVAISVVLLIGAGLLVRSFARLQAFDPGLNPHRLLTMTVSLAGHAEYVGARREAIYRQILDEVKALPGVQSASMINHLPIGGDMFGEGLAIEGLPLPPPGQEPDGIYRVARPGYFATMGIPLLAGRDFTDHDNEKAPDVVIVNEKLARSVWPHESAIGKRLTTDDPRKNPNWRTVIGVVRNVVQWQWAREADNEFYFPFLQDKTYMESPKSFAAYMTLVIRTKTDPLAMSNAVQNTVWSINKDLPLSEIQAMDQVIAGSVWQQRLNLLLVGLFAVVAVVLAAVGIYGVMAYSVTQRTHEIGIRMALGASRREVRGMVVREAMALAVIGGAIGLGGAFALTRVLADLLYQVKPTDPEIFTAVPLLFGAIAFLASYLPARRATNVDPMLALRWE
jgi:predicted permease